MKTILCYGDSNTWGFMPKPTHVDVQATNRYPWGVRWTSLLQQALGSEYLVAEAGLNGRTTMFDCPLAEHRNGLADIDTVMLQQTPVDLVTIMLGTNDTKEHFHASPFLISRGAQRIIENIRAGGYGPGGCCPEILLMAPIRMNANVCEGWIGNEFGPGAYEKDGQLAQHLQLVAEKCGVHFFNAAAHITADPIDGIHMNEEGHALMAKLVEEKVRGILG